MGRIGRRWGGERGSMVPLVAVVALGVGGLCLGLGRLGSQAADAAGARTAADAAALAGAAAGEAAAHAMAEANGAELTAFSVIGAEVEVRVERGGAGVVARARRVVPEPGSGALSPTVGLDPALVSALAEAGLVLGYPVPIVSGWRSSAQQQALWNRREANPYPVAAPGTSAHEQGLAIDVPLSFVSTLSAISAQVGLCNPMPVTDPVHFVLC